MFTSLTGAGVVGLCLPDIRALRRLHAIAQAVASASPPCPAQVIAINTETARVTVDAKLGDAPTAIVVDLLDGPVVVGDWLLITRGYATGRCLPPRTAPTTVIGQSMLGTGGGPT